MKIFVGQVFGRLRAEAFTGIGKWNRERWRCACECGHIFVASDTDLRSGRTKTCGCVSGVRPQRPVSQSDLKVLFSYDPDTGVFTRLRDVRNGKAGDKAGFIQPNGYVSFSVGGKQYDAHRLAWRYMTGEWPVGEVDHKNRIRSDNRWDNLRDAKSQQNRFNAGLRSDNTSSFKGVGRKKKFWCARGRKDGKQLHLGTFIAPEDAARAYDNWAAKEFGEFACLNFPRSGFVSLKGIKL